MNPEETASSPRSTVWGSLANPVGFFALFRWLSWLVALTVVLTRASPTINLRYEPWLLIYAAAQLLLLGAYTLVLNPRRARLQGAAMTRGPSVGLIVAGMADICSSLAIVYLSGGWGSPFWNYLVTSLLLPCFLLSARWSAITALGYTGGYLLILAASGDSLARATQGSQLAGFIGVIATPLLVVLQVTYLGSLFRRVEAERLRTRAALHETDTLFQIAQGLVDRGIDVDALLTWVSDVMRASGLFHEHALLLRDERGGLRLVASGSAANEAVTTLAARAAQEGRTVTLPQPLGAAFDVAVPLLASENLLGVLVARFTQDAQGPGRSLSVAQAIGNQIAVGLYNIRLARQDHERTLQLEAMNRTLAEAREEAERASRAKTEFLSRTSHELRTPLNSILGFGQLLEADQLSPDQRESVQHILAAGRHLLDLINEVLEISRIESGGVHLSAEPVLVSQALAEAMDLVRPMAAERRVRLEHPTGDALGQHVLADHQRLRQVFLNLLSNAIKFNVAGGAVFVSCEPASPERVRISVTDTGRGIALDQMGRLFTPFDRLGAERLGVEGTGLGLALSKRLVEAMAGTIGVASAVGKGSTFWLDLPAAHELLDSGEVVAKEVVATAKDAAPQKARTVLCIEDNAANLRLVQRVLAARPEIELISAMRGTEGLELARQRAPSLVLLDLHLPDMSGQEVLRRLQEEPGTRGIQVVILSADANPGQVDRLLASGALSYLTKPIDVRRLLQVVEQALQERGA